MQKFTVIQYRMRTQRLLKVCKCESIIASLSMANFAFR